MKPSLVVKNYSEKSFSGKSLAILLFAVLAKGVSFRFMAKGFSMSPFIKHGDVITIERIDEKRLRVGNVYAVYHTISEKLMVHRLIEIKEGLCMLKGDNNPETDEMVSTDKLLGIVKKVERNGEKIYFGFGKERVIIAWLARINILFPLLRNIRAFRFDSKKTGSRNN